MSVKYINGAKLEDKLYKKRLKVEKKINLCISKYCFLKCKGCYNNFCKLKEITFDQLSSFLEYAKKQGLEKVTLSGGDPLARNDIGQIIRKCVDLNLKVNLDTVGLTFTDDRKVIGKKTIVKKFKDIHLLDKIEMIGIPFDGSTDEIMSKFRIYDGDLYKETIGILEFFEDRNINICINTVCHNENINDMEDILKVISNYKCIKKWQVFQYMPIGPLGKKNEAIFKVDKADFNRVKNKIINHNNTNIKIEFKVAEERAYNYMLIDSSGKAYKVDLENKIDTFGNISDNETWENIINNLY